MVLLCDRVDVTSLLSGRCGQDNHVAVCDSVTRVSNGCTEEYKSRSVFPPEKIALTTTVGPWFRPVVTTMAVCRVGGISVGVVGDIIIIQVLVLLLT